MGQPQSGHSKARDAAQTGHDASCLMAALRARRAGCGDSENLWKSEGGSGAGRWRRKNEKKGRACAGAIRLSRRVVARSEEPIFFVAVCLHHASLRLLLAFHRRDVHRRPHRPRPRRCSAHRRRHRHRLPRPRLSLSPRSPLTPTPDRCTRPSQSTRACHSPSSARAISG